MMQIKLENEYDKTAMNVRVAVCNEPATRKVVVKNITLLLELPFSRWKFGNIGMLNINIYQK